MHCKPRTQCHPFAGMHWLTRALRCCWRLSELQRFGLEMLLRGIDLRLLAANLLLALLSAGAIPGKPPRQPAALPLTRPALPFVPKAILLQVRIISLHMNRSIMRPSLVTSQMTQPYSPVVPLCIDKHLSANWMHQ